MNLHKNKGILVWRILNIKNNIVFLILLIIFIFVNLKIKYIILNILFILAMIILQHMES